MSRDHIYLCHPNARLHPAMPRWIAEVQAAISEDHAWSDWRLHTWECDMRCAVSINDVTAAIRSAVGPCVLIRNVQSKVLVALRERLYDYTVVLDGDAASSADILRLLRQARDLHIAGEPMLPRKLIVALLLIAKLQRERMWGGRNKGYMWVSNLAKGRGLGEGFADQVPAVINDLLNNNLIIQKKSKGKSKYALNPDKRLAIYEAIGERAFPPNLHRILSRDKRVESARHLDSFIQQAASDDRAT